MGKRLEPSSISNYHPEIYRSLVITYYFGRSAIEMNYFTTPLPELERRSGFDRRDRKIRVFSKYWFIGKRTVIRRKEDRQKPILIDRYSTKIFAAILLIITSCVTDAMLTLNLVSLGAEELNPLMAYYLDQSPLVFFLVKYLLTSAAILIILFNKNLHLFNTRVQAKALFVLLLLPYALVIQWELYLILFVH